MVRNNDKGYDQKAAAWQPTKPPYDLHDDEKELAKRRAAGEIETKRLKQDGTWETVDFDKL
jgi:hypothetical protein